MNLKKIIIFFNFKFFNLNIIKYPILFDDKITSTYSYISIFTIFYKFCIILSFLFLFIKK